MQTETTFHNRLREVRFVFVIMLFLLNGCGSVPRELLTTEDTQIRLESSNREGIRVRYLGNGGLLIHSGAASVMTAPLFTMPRNLALLLPFEPDPRRVEVGLRGLDLDPVEAILVGHAHYDHIGDLPYVIRHMPRARIFGSLTMTLTLEPVIPPELLIPLNEKVGTHERPGSWIYLNDRRIRFMAFISEHGPHFKGLSLASTAHLKPTRGRYPIGLGLCWPDGRDGRPSNALCWPEGQTFVYVIDFLDEGGSIAFRLFYQDAASGNGIGHIAAEILQEKPVDLAVLCVGAYAESERYPTHILEHLKPRHVMMIHWEDFFLWPKHTPPLKIVRTDIEGFIQLIEKQGLPWTLPVPGVELTFTPS